MSKWKQRLHSPASICCFWCSSRETVARKRAAWSAFLDDDDCTRIRNENENSLEYLERGTFSFQSLDCIFQRLCLTAMWWDSLLLVVLQGIDYQSSIYQNRATSKLELTLFLLCPIRITLFLQLARQFFNFGSTTIVDDVTLLEFILRLRCLELKVFTFAISNSKTLWQRIDLTKMNCNQTFNATFLELVDCMSLFLTRISSRWPSRISFSLFKRAFSSLTVSWSAFKASSCCKRILTFLLSSACFSEDSRKRTCSYFESDSRKDHLESLDLPGQIVALLN